MKYYARLENNVVVEVIKTDSDISKLYHHDFVAELIECNSTVTQGLIYQNGEFVENQSSTEQSIEEWRNSAKISKAKAKLNLKAAGLLSKVLMLMDLLDPTDDIRILWDDSIEFNRNNAVLIEFCTTQLQLTTEEIDALFTVQ